MCETEGGGETNHTIETRGKGLRTSDMNGSTHIVPHLVPYTYGSTHLVQQDVCCHEHWVCQKPRPHILALLTALVFELMHVWAEGSEVVAGIKV